MKKEIKREIGDKIFIKTLTYHYVGEIFWITNQSILLTKVSWIADSGRFGEFLKTGEASEVEVYPTDLISEIYFQNIVEIIEWKHELPKVTK